MKKYTLLLVFSFILFISCSGNEEESEFSDIIGTWKMVDYEYSGSSRVTFEDTTVVSDFTGEAFNLNNTVTFSETNTLTSTGSFSLRLSTTTLGETIVTTQTGLRAIEGATWKIEGDELVSTVNGLSNSLKIIELTDTKLILYSESEQTVDTSSFSSKTSIEVKVILER